MPSKFGVFIEISVGSMIGGYLPVLWGGEVLSYSGLLFSGVGGILGVIVVIKIAQWIA